MEGEKKNSNNNQKKPSKGRQVISQEDLATAFLNLRSEIYKEAVELSMICGAEVGLATFSPTGNGSTFTTSSMEETFGRFMDLPPPSDNETMEARLAMLSERFNELDQSLKAETEKSSEEEELAGWWKVPVDELGVDELREMGDSLKKLQERINGEKSTDEDVAM